MFGYRILLLVLVFSVAISQGASANSIEDDRLGVEPHYNSGDEDQIKKLEKENKKLKDRVISLQNIINILIEKKSCIIPLWY